MTALSSWVPFKKAFAVLPTTTFMATSTADNKSAWYPRAHRAVGALHSRPLRPKLLPVVNFSLFTGRQLQLLKMWSTLTVSRKWCRICTWIMWKRHVSLVSNRIYKQFFWKWKCLRECIQPLIVGSSLEYLVKMAETTGVDRCFTLGILALHSTVKISKTPRVSLKMKIVLVCEAVQHVDSICCGKYFVDWRSAYRSPCLKN